MARANDYATFTSNADNRGMLVRREPAAGVCHAPGLHWGRDVGGAVSIPLSTGALQFCRFVAAEGAGAAGPKGAGRMAKEMSPHEA